MPYEKRARNPLNARLFSFAFLRWVVFCPYAARRGCENCLSGGGERAEIREFTDWVCFDLKWAFSPISHELSLFAFGELSACKDLQSNLFHEYFANTSFHI